MSVFAIELGSAPVDVNCAQLGDDSYYERAQIECKAYINQLRRQLKSKFNVAALDNITFVVKRFAHDFGAYYEVVGRCDDSNAHAIEMLFYIEDNLPLGWDVEAKQELQKGCYARI